VTFETSVAGNLMVHGFLVALFWDFGIV